MNMAVMVPGSGMISTLCPFGPSSRRTCFNSPFGISLRTRESRLARSAAACANPSWERVVKRVAFEVVGDALRLRAGVSPYGYPQGVQQCSEDADPAGESHRHAHLVVQPGSYLAVSLGHLVVDAELIQRRLGLFQNAPPPSFVQPRHAPAHVEHGRLARLGITHIETMRFATQWHLSKPVGADPAKKARRPTRRA